MIHRLTILANLCGRPFEKYNLSAIWHCWSPRRIKFLCPWHLPSRRITVGAAEWQTTTDHHESIGGEYSNVYQNGLPSAWITQPVGIGHLLPMIIYDQNNPFGQFRERTLKGWIAAHSPSVRCEDAYWSVCPSLRKENSNQCLSFGRKCRPRTRKKHAVSITELLLSRR